MQGFNLLDFVGDEVLRQDILQADAGVRAQSFLEKYNEQAFLKFDAD